MKFIVRTDCHLSDKAPTSRVDDYLNTCLDKLKQIGNLAKKHKATAVIDNGDFFDSTVAKNNSHSMVRRVIELHKEHYPCPVYENPGNHDFPYKNLKYIRRMPLGVLFASGTFKQLTDKTFKEDDLTVRVVGLPYKSKFDIEDFDIQRGDEDVLVCAAHTYASLNGGELFDGSDYAMSYHDLSECSPDFFIFGHWHIDQGIESLNGTKFMNLGSMTRGSLVQDNLDRTPRVGILEIQKDEDGIVSVSAEAVELDVEPAEDVFDLEKHQRLEQEERDINQFVTSLKMASMEDEDDIFSVVSSLTEFQDDVKTTAIRYLKDVSSKED